MTGQGQLGSYADAGLLASIELVNALAPGPGRPRSASAAEAVAALQPVLAIDPPSLEQLSDGDVPAFVDLAERLRAVFVDLQGADVDAAAERLNMLLATHPAHPHLAKEKGQWRLHHHPVDAALVPMWTAICAEGMARVVGAGLAHRLGTCADAACGRAYFDLSKNGSRRFCSTTCQNRVKAAAFRRRRTESGS